jgi:hypothetical protein
LQKPLVQQQMKHLLQQMHLKQQNLQQQKQQQIQSN